MTSNDDFLNAFQQYMQSGNANSLASYMLDPQSKSFLSIYRNGFLKAAIEALKGNYPTLARLLEADHFLYLARSYIDLYPPNSTSLVGYGMKNSSAKVCFIDFLRTEENLQKHTYLFDICLLDETWLQTLNATSSDSITLTEVQEFIANGEDLSLLPMTVIPSSKIIRLSFNLFDLWSEMKFSDALDELILNTENLDEIENYLLFWQQNNQVQAKILTLPDKAFLQTLRQTFNLEKAEKEASSIDEDFDLSLLFADLLNGGLLKLVV